MIQSITNIVRWFSSQKHIYFLLGILFIIPNFVLFVTDPQPIVIGIASLILPLALWYGLMLITRKPGIIALCLLPIIILNGGQIVLLELFGQSVIAVDMYLNLISSDASEASELLANIALIIGCVLVLYVVPTIWLAIHSVRLKETLSNSFRKKSALLIFITVLLVCIFAPLQDYHFSWKNDIYPVNALYNLHFAIHKAAKNEKYPITSADFKFHSKRTDIAKGKREIYVLVVGETSRAMEWSLYGYKKETTPCLEKIDGLVHFRDVVTQSNNTQKSVPIILSAACAENYGIIYDEKSVVSAFKEAGFHTLVIANQKLTTLMIYSFYHEADKFIDLSKFHSGSYLTSLYDGALLPYLKKEIDNTPGNMFIVIHTYGSHFKYSDRYPKNFQIFTPDKFEGISVAYKKQMRNAYDNSIRYTDYVLSQIIDVLEQTNSCSSMLYLSDHGEDIFDDARERYLHASPVPTYYQLHIPYIIWFSKPYRETFPDKFDEAMDHQAFPVSTNSVFHTILDIANVKTDETIPSLALTNRAFRVSDRMYLDDHDEPIPFWKVGLKKKISP